MFNEIALGYIDFWKEMVPIGRTMSGASGAPVTVIEFADFECPACRGFQPAIESIMERWPTDVHTVYVAHPLSYHRFALGAARAVECVSEAAELRRLVNLLYGKQDSLGLKSWGSYALEAGVADTTRIANCAANPAPVERIERGVELGTRIRLAGTPTVIVNGWRYPRTPTEDQLHQAVEAILLGDDPFSNR